MQAVPALAQRLPPLSALHVPRTPGARATFQGGHRLRAVVRAPVRPFGPSLPPSAACGPLPCPPWAAGRRPPRPGPLGRPGVMWRPRSGPCGPRPGQVGRLRCSGAPLRNARPSPCGAACSGPCVAPPPRRLRRRCSGAARPPLCGSCGAVRPSGPSRLRRSGVAAASPSPPTAAEPGLSAGGSLACGPLRGLGLAAPRQPCGAAI